jgi:FMN phosphatase YigB (HAD superfamily)
MTPQLRSIIFDLDDTLLKTSETLLPAAQKESWLALKNAGVYIEWDEFLSKWQQASALGTSGKDLISTFVEGLGPVGDLDRIKENLRKAFYGRNVKENLVLFDGAEALLAKLKDHFELHLLTAGFHYCDIEHGESKDGHFKRLLERSPWMPEEHLSVGNRRDTDIGPAKSRGMKTCLLLRGEHVHQKARDPSEIPDFEIEDIRDLMKVCRVLAPAFSS